MNTPEINTWQGVQDEVLRRIRQRLWKPGASIPNEADLAVEFGCARTTVNRALRELAERGILERKRRSGTRVALHPVARAVLTIPTVRSEVEDSGGQYGYRLITRAVMAPPPAIADALDVAQGAQALHIVALHRADDAPYAIEDRWINLTTVPQARDVDFAARSANEWLLETVPYERAILDISAATAAAQDCDHLGAPNQAPVLRMARTTWGAQGVITHVVLTHRPGHHIISPIAG